MKLAAGWSVIFTAALVAIAPDVFGQEHGSTVNDGTNSFPPTTCSDDLKSGALTLSAISITNGTVNSVMLKGTATVANPSSCTYTLRTVWGPLPAPPFANGAVVGTLPPSPLNWSIAATSLAGGVYAARNEVTKLCGTVSSSCVGAPRQFELPKSTDGSGSICIVKFDDRNGNGKQDGEPALGNWNFEIKTATGTPVATIKTEAGPKVCASVKAPENYVIAEVPQPGWVPTNPSTGYLKVSLSPGQTLNLAFGNRRAK